MAGGRLQYHKMLTADDAVRVESDGKKKRPYDTVLPLANDLGIQVDTSCDCEDNECVANAIHNYKGEGNILVRYGFSSV